MHQRPPCWQLRWRPVEEYTGPTGIATAQSCPPSRITKVIPAVACVALDDQTVEFDFGTNLSGWFHLRLPQLEAGKTVTMHYADKRFQSVEGDDTPAGKVKPALDPKKIETAKGPAYYQTNNQRTEFISAGKPGEEFCNKFNYEGFRYVIVQGLPVKPALGDAEALFIESDLEPVGSFECSNALFNRIHQVNLWTIRCLNLGGYMVDCPHRERMGYGDGQNGIDSHVMNLDASAFYGKTPACWAPISCSNISWNPGAMIWPIPSSTSGIFPGWGYMLSQGATTFWEQWNGSWSQIHSCYVSPGSWFYQGLAGIRPDESGPGFKKIIIKPAVVGDVTWVKCHYDSIHGRIVSNWKLQGDGLTMEITVPANTTATVYVPAKDQAGVTESGLPAAKAEGVSFLRMENHSAVFAVGSGNYRFQSAVPAKESADCPPANGAGSPRAR